jgi:hypothetical protein
LDQTRYIVKTWDHEYVGLEMVILLSRVYAFCEEKGHVVMDYPFVHFHIRECIIKHVELQNINVSTTGIVTTNSCNSK